MKLKNWKTEKLNGESLPGSLWKKQFFSFSVFQFPELFRNISGEIEKLKNWIFQGHSGRDSPYGFSFSVFQFLRKYSAIVPETEKLKNWIHMENLCLHVPGKFSFSVFQFLRKYSEIVPETEKLKNWKTKKLFFPERSRKRFSILIQFFSFLVFQFFSFSGNIPK